jgi:hypothetical protein
VPPVGLPVRFVWTPRRGEPRIAPGGSRRPRGLRLRLPLLRRVRLLQCVCPAISTHRGTPLLAAHCAPLSTGRLTGSIFASGGFRPRAWSVIVRVRAPLFEAFARCSDLCKCGSRTRSTCRPFGHATTGWSSALSPAWRVRRCGLRSLAPRLTPDGACPRSRPQGPSTQRRRPQARRRSASSWCFAASSCCSRAVWQRGPSERRAAGSTIAASLRWSCRSAWPSGCGAHA